MPNYEKTRWFLVLKLSKPNDNQLNKLLQISNQTAGSFGQPLLYAPSPSPMDSVQPRTKNARKHQSNRGGKTVFSSGLSTSALAKVDASSAFHISIAWTLERPSRTLLDHFDSCKDDFQATKIQVNTVKVKMGNIITSLPLAPKIIGSNGIIEKSSARS